MRDYEKTWALFRPSHLWCRVILRYCCTLGVDRSCTSFWSYQITSSTLPPPRRFVWWCSLTPNTLGMLDLEKFPCRAFKTRRYSSTTTRPKWIKNIIRDMIVYISQEKTTTTKPAIPNTSSKRQNLPRPTGPSWGTTGVREARQSSWDKRKKPGAWTGLDWSGLSGELLWRQWGPPWTPQYPPTLTAPRSPFPGSCSAHGPCGQV